MISYLPMCIIIVVGDFSNLDFGFSESQYGLSQIFLDATHRSQQCIG